MKNSNYKIWRQRQFSHTVIATKNTVALKVIHFDHPKRKAVENFIQKQYRRKFEVSACDMMPDIFACFIENELYAAMGFRAADKDKLFLEQYLDRPIEDYMSQHAGIKIKRNNIVEVGSLATANSVCRSARHSNII